MYRHVISAVCDRLRGRLLQRITVPWTWERAMASKGNTKKHENRLAQEKSPYLLQHATNPIDWYPWGQDAFDRAKREDKLIFLSVGYSTCHWCHVMERESFKNTEVADIMNENFVNVKVDREERPDVDKVYMTFVQATAGRGGWPMSVWLTPDLRPIVGGTYFPPEDRYFGKPGFKSILLMVAEKWKEDREKMEQQGTMIYEALKKHVSQDMSSEQNLPGTKIAIKCFSTLQAAFDQHKGGFGKAPKFPQPANLNFMLWMQCVSFADGNSQSALDMALLTLDMIAKGGIHDHIAKGFHRYSTDDDWHVPHFEKMLYDQAQLAVSYIDAYQLTKETKFSDVASGIFQYVNSNLSDEAGGFYSGEDADSLPTADSTEMKEGAFCVWSWQDIHQLLEGVVREEITQADVFCHHYNIKKEGNVDPYKDPHDELKGQNVLICSGSVTSTALKFDLTEEQVEQVLDQCRHLLVKVRKNRPPPLLDNKMLTSWNGLMISAFARGGQVFCREELTERAKKAAEFIQDHLYHPESGILMRSAYPINNQTQSSPQIEGFLDDYAYLIRGLLDLYEACFEERWLEWADNLQTRQNELFWDTEHAGYFISGTADSSIILRMKEDQDGAEPSGNSIAAMNLLRLADFLDNSHYRDMAVKLLTAFGERLENIPHALPEMVCALMYLHSTAKQIVIVGELDADDTVALIRCVRDKFLPNKVLILAHDNHSSFLYQRLPFLKTLNKIDDKATAYVCENYSCSLPLNSPEELSKLL